MISHGYYIGGKGKFRGRAGAYGIASPWFHHGFSDEVLVQIPQTVGSEDGLQPCLYQVLRSPLLYSFTEFEGLLNAIRTCDIIVV